MKRLLVILDQGIRGPTAIVCTVVGLIVLAVLIFLPLPWSYFPNLGRIFSASWLHLLICSSIAYSGAVVVAKRAGLPMDAVSCVIVGVLWKFTPAFQFLPFNFSRWVLIYGVAGLTAHCCRRAVIALRGTVSVPGDPAKPEATANPPPAGKQP